jgi:hypothetical protein
MNTKEERERRTYLPCRIDTTGLSLIESGDAVVRIEAHDEGGDAERPDTAGLGVSL